jgi:predicted DNA-binding transcriptional regulator AlpA
MFVHTSPNTRLLNITETAERLSVSPSYLNKLRVTGGGPPYVKIGARVAYDPADLAAWLDAQKRSSTSEVTDRVSA